MTMRNIISAVIIGVVSAAASTALLAPAHSGPAPKESAYARVLRTGTIRCGYSVWAPLMYVDPNSHEKRGVFPDMIEEAAQRLGLKVVWQEEIGWGSVPEALRAGRVDMACAGYWLNSGRIRTTSSTTPQLYSPLYVWGRPDETRKFSSIEALNKAEFKTDRIDGSVEGSIVEKRLPQVGFVSFSELGTTADKILSLLTHKTDFTVLGPSDVKAYKEKNPQGLKNLFPNQPLVSFPTVMLMPPEEPQLKEMIDNILLSMEYDGTIDAILKKNGMDDAFLRNTRVAVK
jgi:ABC-type amino acid transport substrate-binding protein